MLRLRNTSVRRDPSSGKDDTSCHPGHRGHRLRHVLDILHCSLLQHDRHRRSHRNVNVGPNPGSFLSGPPVQGWSDCAGSAHHRNWLRLPDGLPHVAKSTMLELRSRPRHTLVVILLQGSTPTWCAASCPSAELGSGVHCGLPLPWLGHGIQ